MDNFVANKLNEWIRSAFLRMGYNIDLRKIKYGAFPLHIDDEFVRLLGIIRDHTLVPWEGLFLNYQAAKWIKAQRIPGDIVECGVFRGGSVLLLAMALQEPARSIWLYDTFEGMSAPTERDVSILGGAQESYRKSLRKDGTSAWCLVDIDSVAEFFARHVPQAQMVFVKGLVEDTLPIIKNRPQQIAILRLDTDFYESTKTEMRYLYPLLSKGGVLIIDDYSFWRGAREAVDEYFAENDLRPTLFVDPHSGRVMHFKE